MSSIDLVRTGLEAWERGDTTTLASQLTDDFVLSGPLPQPIGRDQFLAVYRALHTAIPDWQFHARDFREEGHQVHVTVEVTGTHTGPLAVIPGVPPVPPTGKPIHLPAEHLTFTLRGEQVSAETLDSQPGGGVAGIYAQVGAPLG
jgi:predicted ester cyclase